MPRLVQAVPRYRKHRQSGQAICTINGRDHLLGPHGTRASKLEYDRLIGEWLASGRSASYGAPARDVTIVEIAADYIAFAKRNYGTAPNSEWARLRKILAPVLALYGRTPAAEFGVLQLKTIREKYVETGCARLTVNADVRRIVRMFRWAAAEGRISPIVPQTLAIVPGLRKGKSAARETAPVMPVDDDTVDATLPNLPDVPADMVRFQRLTGCRPAEVCMLRPCDVDRSGDVWLYRPERHKTEHHGRGRTILVGPKAQAVLLRYLARDAGAYCFRPCDTMAKHFAARETARVTPHSYGNRRGSNRCRRPRKTPGERYSTSSYGKAIAAGCAKAFPCAELAGIPRNMLTSDQRSTLRAWNCEHRWSPNQLRHAAATEIRSQFGLEAAQVVLGHARADVTQVYAERDLAKGLEVARRIG